MKRTEGIQKWRTQFGLAQAHRLGRMSDRIRASMQEFKARFRNDISESYSALRNVIRNLHRHLTRHESTIVLILTCSGISVASLLFLGKFMGTEYREVVFHVVTPDHTSVDSINVYIQVRSPFCNLEADAIFMHVILDSASASADTVDLVYPSGLKPLSRGPLDSLTVRETWGDRIASRQVPFRLADRRLLAGDDLFGRVFCSTKQELALWIRIEVDPRHWQEGSIDTMGVLVSISNLGVLDVLAAPDHFEQTGSDDLVWRGEGSSHSLFFRVRDRRGTQARENVLFILGTVIGTTTGVLGAIFVNLAQARDRVRCESVPGQIA